MRLPLRALLVILFAGLPAGGPAGPSRAAVGAGKGGTKKPAAPPPPAGAKFFRISSDGCLMAIDDCGLGAPDGKRELYSNCSAESSVRMAAMWHGVWASETAARRAGLKGGGKAHWLQSSHLPRAVEAFGLSCEVWNYRRDEPLSNFLAWLRGHLRAGHPVVVGVKLHPSRPGYGEDWCVDRHMLAVGCDAGGLTCNTTCGFRHGRSWRQLASTDRGWSFRSKRDRCYGCAVVGPRRGAATRPVHLYVKAQTPKTVDLAVHADLLNPGRPYTLLRFDCPDAKAPDRFEPRAAAFAKAFVAGGPSHSLVQRVPRHRLTVYRCVPGKVELAGRAERQAPPAAPPPRDKLPPPSAGSDLRFFKVTAGGCKINIPDRAQDRTVHPGGRYPGACGEASLHNGLLYLGVWMSQTMAWTVGRRPTNTYGWLDTGDFPYALERLGVTHEIWYWRADKTMSEYFRWLRDHLRAEHPVLIAVKLYPTPRTYPREWHCDHFMLAVGYDRGTLTYNPNRGRQETRSWDLLTSTRRGYSFLNMQGVCYGCAMTGVRDSQTTLPVHLYVQSQTRTRVVLKVWVDRLRPGRRYALLRFDCPKAVAPKRFDRASAQHSKTFVAARKTASSTDRLPRHRVAIYRCMPLAGS